MRNLKPYIADCEAELRSVGLAVPGGIRYTVNRRAIRRWGLCQGNPRGGFEIQIAEILLDERIPEKSLKTVLLHEMLHAIDYGDGHGATWKAHAALLNRRYGYAIKRASSAIEMEIPFDTGYYDEESREKAVKRAREKTVKHRFVCEKCGEEVLRYRESRFTKNYRNYRCGRCGGRFRKEF